MEYKEWLPSLRESPRGHIDELSRPRTLSRRTLERANMGTAASKQLSPRIHKLNQVIDTARRARRDGATDARECVSRTDESRRNAWLCGLVRKTRSALQPRAKCAHSLSSHFSDHWNHEQSAAHFPNI